MEVENSILEPAIEIFNMFGNLLIIGFEFFKSFEYLGRKEKVFERNKMDFILLSNRLAF